MGRVSLFSKRDEILHLALPLLIVFGALLATLSGHRMSLHEVGLANVLVNVVFLNLTHTGFTFVMLFCFPEIKSWIAERTDNKPHLIWLHWIAVFALIGFFFLRGQNLIFDALQNEIGEQLILWALAGWAAYHSIIQSYGISRLYDRALLQELPPRGREFDRVLRGARKRGWLFFGLIGLALVYALIRGLAPLAPLVQFSHWLVTAEIGVVTLILANSISQASSFKSNQFIFLARLYCLPISQISFYGLLGLMAIHGVEYFYVFKRMLSLSEARKSHPALLWTTTSLVTIPVIACALARKELIQHSLASWFPGQLEVWAALGLLSRAISFSHYYVDGFLFRMSNPSNRRHILPLLVPDRKAPRAVTS